MSAPFVCWTCGAEFPDEAKFDAHLAEVREMEAEAVERLLRSGDVR